MLRPFRISDAEASYSWFGDPEVMKYAFGADATIEDTAARLDRYIQHQNQWRFSKWIVIDRQTKQPIGDAGFFQMPEEKGVELGYRLARSSWGLGLATEVARKWTEVASDFLDVPTLFAYAHRENAPSFRVMQKVGFVFSRMEVIYGSEVLLFELPVPPTKTPAS